MKIKNSNTGQLPPSPLCQLSLVLSVGVYSLVLCRVFPSQVGSMAYGNI